MPLKAHGEQLYGEHPYSVHLDAVASIAEPYGPTATTIAYLHDVLEDTPATAEDIEKCFGPLVARGVGILTDEPGKNRKERKAKTFEKIAAVEGPETVALIVKAADRLANMRACVADGNTRLLKLYRSEHATFRAVAFRHGLCDALWRQLDRLAEP